VKELLARGHDVINIDRKQAANPLTRFVYADLTRREQVQPIFEQVEAVCHLGEIPSVNGPRSPEEVIAHNVQAGTVVLQTAADLRLQRVISTSSCQVYGMWDGTATRPQRLPFDETHPVHPHNAYSLGKVTTEQYARLIAEKHGVSVAVFRFPWVPIEEYTEEAAQKMQKMPAKTDGFATYLHAVDAARAYALAIEHPQPGCEVYHLTAAEIHSLQPLAERLRLHHPSFPSLPADWPAFKSPLLLDKAREHFGWEPKWNFLDAYRRQHPEDKRVNS
jgi:nucleoside-diphosphate-sugar epimerase